MRYNKTAALNATQQHTIQGSSQEEKKKHKHDKDEDKKNKGKKRGEAHLGEE